MKLIDYLLDKLPKRLPDSSGWPMVKEDALKLAGMDICIAWFGKECDHILMLNHGSVSREEYFQEKNRREFPISRKNELVRTHG